MVIISLNVSKLEVGGECAFKKKGTCETCAWRNVYFLGNVGGEMSWGKIKWGQPDADAVEKLRRPQQVDMTNWYVPSIINSRSC